MLRILPTLGEGGEELEDDYVVPVDVYDKELFGSEKIKVNTFGMLRTMRNERFQNLPKQKKYDIALDDEDITPADENASIKSVDAMQFPTEDDIKAEFLKSGMLGKIYPDYEERNEQVEMSGEVLAAFRDSKKLAIEAGTGVGKSMAYLIPAIKIAKENEIIVGIATKTNSLLDQLVYHELPALAKQIDGLVYASLKGAKHYICLRKAAMLAGADARVVNFKGEEFCTAASVASLISYIEQTAYDDCDGIKINGRALPNPAYTCGSHECLRNKCPFFHNGCFVHGARRMAKNADIVVTNHSMLFCDIKANNGLLPPIKYWVVDEAHGTEAEARRAFSQDVLASTLLDWGKGLESEKPKFNVFERAARNMDTEEIDDKGTVYGLINKCKSSGKDMANKANLFANGINKLLAFAQKSYNGYEYSTIWIDDKIRESEEFNEIYKLAKAWYDSAEDLITACNKVLAYLEDFKSTAVTSLEISAFTFDVKEAMNACDVIFFNNSDQYVYSSFLNNKKTVKQDKLSAELYTVSDILNERLYSQCKSIIFTSATLATGDSFKAFKDSIGLDSETLECQLASSFDYDNNMTIYITNDMSQPNAPEFGEQLNPFLADLHIAGDGSILTLFTNRRQMEKAFEVVNEKIKTKNLRLLMQK